MDTDVAIAGTGCNWDSSAGGASNKCDNSETIIARNICRLSIVIGARSYGGGGANGTLTITTAISGVEVGKHSYSLSGSNGYWQYNAKAININPVDEDLICRAVGNVSCSGKNSYCSVSFKVTYTNIVVL